MIDGECIMRMNRVMCEEEEVKWEGCFFFIKSFWSWLFW